ncbi:MAG: hypothetical protein CMM07_16730 [Rhodopirellula sp.]|nr:hypothetical protein [Rhodopirellula sp.]
MKSLTAMHSVQLYELGSLQPHSDPTTKSMLGIAATRTYTESAGSFEVYDNANAVTAQSMRRMLINGMNRRKKPSP